MVRTANIKIIIGLIALLFCHIGYGYKCTIKTKMKPIRYIILLLLGVSLGRYATAQTNEDYFVLGTFSDYSGYDYIDTVNCEVDHYDYHQKKLADYMRSSITRRYSEACSKKTPNRYHLYSCQQYKVLASLYKQTNNLQDNIFATREQALSYLHGVYLRFGHPVNDTLYLIRVHNSSHGRLFNKVAQPLGFTNMSVEELNTIPHTTRVYFTPSAEFLEFIRPTEKLKKKLLADEEDFWRKILGVSQEEFEELRNKSHE